MSTLNGVFTYDKMIYMKQKMDALYSQFSGNYNDLTNKPTAVSDFSNDSGFQTAAQVAVLIDSATELLATTADSKLQHKLHLLYPVQQEVLQRRRN